MASPKTLNWYTTAMEAIQGVDLTGEIIHANSLTPRKVFLAVKGLSIYAPKQALYWLMWNIPDMHVSINMFLVQIFAWTSTCSRFFESLIP